MRCDTQIYFVTEGKRALITDRSSQDYGGYTNGQAAEVDMMADVTDTQTSTQQLVYGKLREGSVTVRLNGHHLEPFDHIRIIDRNTGVSKLFDVDAVRHLRQRSVFICHERR
ncbi:MAG: hypothetical protein E7238_00220 [Sarcina sp.]|nr:hypothetical protein [Sarcina sp.]